MKSSYELALERLEKEGIAKPSETALTDEDRGKIAEARRHTEAKIAELEILHRDAARKLRDPESLLRADEEYARERRRLEDAGDAKVAKLRRESTSS